MEKDFWLEFAWESKAYLRLFLLGADNWSWLGTLLDALGKVLNPTGMTSMEEAQLDILEEVSLISLPEVSEDVRKILSGKASGVDEMLKA